MGADQIDWDKNTFQVIIDSVCKNNSNLADILTFLEDEEPIGRKMFASLHTTGDFLGIPMGTTHFIDVVSQELYFNGFIEHTPFDEDNYEEHVEELAEFLRRNYGMSGEKIMKVMGLSLGVRKKMQHNVTKKAVKAVEKEEQK